MNEIRFNCKTWFEDCKNLEKRRLEKKLQKEKKEDNQHCDACITLGPRSELRFSVWCLVFCHQEKKKVLS